jgi:uncharacterized membrane protein YidH (DUF202 family)
MCSILADYMVIALERTFMGYLRTSLALSVTGVTIAQLFRLQHSYNPDADFGFFVTGTPLAACFIIAAIIVLSLGAIRFWKQQSAIVRGKVIAGGWEINVIMIGSLLVSHFKHESLIYAIAYKSSYVLRYSQ